MSTQNPDGSTITPRHPDAEATELAAEKAAQDQAAYVKLRETVLAAPSASLDFATIPQTFKGLKLFGNLRGSDAAVFIGAILNINGDVTDGNYFQQQLRGSGGDAPAAENLGAATSRVMGLMPAAGAVANHWCQIEATIYDYASAKIHPVDVKITSSWGVATTNIQTRQVTVLRNAAQAIDRLTLAPSAGNFIAGSMASLYGIKSSFG